MISVCGPRLRRGNPASASSAKYARNSATTRGTDSDTNSLPWTDEFVGRDPSAVGEYNPRTPDAVGSDVRLGAAILSALTSSPHAENRPVQAHRPGGSS